MGENKRKARRIPVGWTLEIKNRNGDNIRSRILNISQTGILFMSPHHFQNNEMLKMVIVVRPTFQVQCVARIVRELPGSSRIATFAAEFFRFADHGEKLLMETLTEVLKRAPEERLPTVPEPKSPPRVEPTPAVDPNAGLRRNTRGPIVIRR